MRRRIGIYEVVFELGEDVGLKAGGQIDVAEHSLAGMVASLLRVRRHHLPTAQNPFPLNLDIGDLNATNSKN